MTPSTVAATGAAIVCISRKMIWPGSAQIIAVDATATASGIWCAAASAPKPR
jgi:hypothetical protein